MYPVLESVCCHHLAELPLKPIGILPERRPSQDYRTRP